MSQTRFPQAGPEESGIWVSASTFSNVATDDRGFFNICSISLIFLFYESFEKKCLQNLIKLVVNHNNSLAFGVHFVLLQFQFWLQSLCMSSCVRMCVVDVHLHACVHALCVCVWYVHVCLRGVCERFAHVHSRVSHLWSQHVPGPTTGHMSGRSSRSAAPHRRLPAGMTRPGSPTETQSTPPPPPRTGRGLGAWKIAGLSSTARGTTERADPWSGGTPANSKELSCLGSPKESSSSKTHKKYFRSVEADTPHKCCWGKKPKPRVAGESQPAGPNPNPTPPGGAKLNGRNRVFCQKFCFPSFLSVCRSK